MNRHDFDDIAALHIQRQLPAVTVMQENNFRRKTHRVDQTNIDISKIQRDGLIFSTLTIIASKPIPILIGIYKPRKVSNKLKKLKNGEESKHEEGTTGKKTSNVCLITVIFSLIQYSVLCLLVWTNLQSLNISLGNRFSCTSKTEQSRNLMKSISGPPITLRKHH